MSRAAARAGRAVDADLAIMDSQFPQKSPLGFRTVEINEYLSRVRRACAYAMHPMLPGEEAWFTHGYGVSEEQFAENLRGYLRHYPMNREKVHYLRPDRGYRFRLAYSFFLAETFVLLPFLESQGTPFVFVLYPGGGFGLENEASDRMLRRIFQSPWFRSVIVTQRLTLDYLVARQLCPAEKIEYIYGGFVQFTRESVRPKVRYGEGKDTFDICFVAAKYSHQGQDKGFDLFMEAARLLSAVAPDLRFHVVGGFSERDIPVGQHPERYRFYGYQPPDFLAEFYSSMDICLTPSRPFRLFPGNFDGFPLGADAAYCGTALFVSDELSMNDHFADGEELVVVPLSAEGIAERVLAAYRDPARLYALAAAGQRRTQELFETDVQIRRRLEVFQKVADIRLRSRR